MYSTTSSSLIDTSAEFQVSMTNSPLREPISPISNEKFSTPVKINESFQKENHTTLSFNSTPYLFSNNISKQINQTIKKPRVNFHSIHDIVYGGENISTTVENDSGFSSFHSKSTNLNDIDEQFSAALAAGSFDRLVSHLCAVADEQKKKRA